MLRWIKKEIQHVLPVFVFFFVAFNIINWMDAFLLKRSGIEPFSFLNIAIAAALVAKIFLLIDHTSLDAPVRKKPLAYVVLWKTILYWAIALIVRFTIRLWPYLFMKEGMAAEFQKFFEQIDWHLFMAVQTWYLILLFLYVVSRELVQAIGREKLRRIFFGKNVL